MRLQLSEPVFDKEKRVIGRISRLIANQSDRQIKAGVLQCTSGQEVVVPTHCFVHDQAGRLILEVEGPVETAFPPFDHTRYYALHPVEWQEEWGAVRGEIVTLFPPLDRDRQARRRFIHASLALMGGIAASLVYPVFRYLIHPITKQLERLWVPLKLRGPLKEDVPLFISYTVKRREGYLEETISKGVWLLKPSKALVMKIAARKENLEFPDLGWANRIGDPVAFSTKCTHLGCNVRWVPEEGQFICACHNSHFKLDGEVISGPAPRGLDTLPLRTDRGRIEIMDVEFRAGRKEKKPA